MTIVAIGGGEIGRPGKPVETTKIDKEIIKLSGKKRPNLLFIPTASDDAAGYVKTVENHFGKRLGCKVDALLLWNREISKAELKDKIDWADIIYVGGGNTLRMLRKWRSIGLDTLLIRAGRKGKVLSGLSAGAACWFEYALSDSRKFSNPNADYIRVRGLGLIPGLFCPHFDAEPGRKPALKKMLKKRGGNAFALDNCAAIVYENGGFRIIASKPRARAYRCFWRERKYRMEVVSK